MRFRGSASLFLLPACLLFGAEIPPATYTVTTGTHVPLALINSVSTRNAAVGDRVYLESVYPILDGAKIVIPPGSYVAGTVTQVKRPGRMRGRGELYIRFDSLTLPNGVTRVFRATLGNLDGLASEQLDKREGKIKSAGNKGGDARTIGETAGAGASIGSIAGAAAGQAGMGAGLGAAAGAAAGLAAVLLTRGPDAVLARGATVEMVVDRPLEFAPADLDFSGAAARIPAIAPPAGPRKHTGGVLMPGAGWPL